MELGLYNRVNKGIERVRIICDVTEPNINLYKFSLNLLITQLQFLTEAIRVFYIKLYLRSASSLISFRQRAHHHKADMVS